MLIVEADAFHSASEVYNDMPWPSDGDPERRRTLHRLGCFREELRKRLDSLLSESQEAVEFAMKQASSVAAALGVRASTLLRPAKLRPRLVGRPQRRRPAR